MAFRKLTPCRPTHGNESHLQLYDVLASKRKDMKDVGEEFMDTMLKGLASWKSAASRGLLLWGFVVLHKPVSKRDGVLRGLFSWNRLLHPEDKASLVQEPIRSTHQAMYGVRM